MGFSLIGSDILPPNLPDLNQVDYFFWDAIEVQLKIKTFNNVHELARKIKESVKKNSSKSIQDAIDCFRSRVYEVVKKSGRVGYK